VYSDGRAEVLCDGDKVTCDVVSIMIKYLLAMIGEVAKVVTSEVLRVFIEEIERMKDEEKGNTVAGVL
jgi:hypothetical protein